MSQSQPSDWICPRCGLTAGEPGKCTVHPEEDLMDARDRDVLEYLMREDDQARSRGATRWVLFLGVLGLALGAFAAWTLNWAAPGGIPRRMITYMTIGGGVLGALGGKAAAHWRFKGRFIKVTHRLFENGDTP